jgi:hypothetical protein
VAARGNATPHRPQGIRIGLPSGKAVIIGKRSDRWQK